MLFTSQGTLRGPSHLTHQFKNPLPRLASCSLRRTSSLDFSKIVSGFGVDHVKVDTYKDLSEEYSKAMKGRESIVIEAVVPSDNVRAHR